MPKTKKNKECCSPQFNMGGVILLTMGALLLFERYFQILNLNIWAIILIVIGGVLILKKH